MLLLFSLCLGGLLLACVKVFKRLGSGRIVALLRLLNVVSDLSELVVKVTEGGADGNRDGSGNSLLDDTGGSSSDELVQQVVLRVSDGESEGVNLSLDIPDSENRVPPVVHGLNVDLDTDTLAGDDDICNSAVGNLGPSLLPSECERDISNVGLDLRKTKSESVVVDVHGLVDVVVRRELELVVGLEFNNVREEVGARQDQV